MGFNIGSATDRGRRRAANEDSVLVREFRPPGRAQKFLIAAIADGMGGLEAGEVASKTAIDSLERVVMGAPVGIAPGDLLVEAFHLAHQEIRRSRRRSGTTIVAALLDDDGVLAVAHVGDSRCYLISSGALVRLTRDHTLAAREVEAGEMTEGEARRSPHRNLLTRSLGTDDALPAVDVFGPRTLGAGEWVVLCSDGLYSVVGESDIADIVRRLSPADAARDLIAIANKRGGPDDASVVVVRREA